MARKDKNEYSLIAHLLKLNYKYKWGNYTSNEQVNKVLSVASKKGTGNIGLPDQIYINEDEKLLILVEEKTNISEHVSKKIGSAPTKYAVDGILWYLNFFTKDKLMKCNHDLSNYFSNWKIVGIAFSGKIDDDYNHRLSTFIIHNNVIEEKNTVTDFLNEKDYLNLFENYDEEEIINNISSSSKKINRQLRSVDSQKRPILLSALMICLFKIKSGGNSFINEYAANTPSEIVNKLQDRVDSVLASESIPEEKRKVLRAELEFIKFDHDLNNLSVLKEILDELKTNVIPLFERKSNYDIIGKFYEEFLRYAGVSNVKKGIVLTPNHITTLFTELIEIKTNDVILDACCGTGSFLIAGMNKLVEKINNSQLTNKQGYIKTLKEKQLIGFEKNSTMYSLAISNMLFRGDGKSQIYNYDYFSLEVDNVLNNLKNNKNDYGNSEPIIPSIGFINPPYGGKDNKDNPTKKEIQFLTRLLDHCSRYVIMIAPLSTYFKDDTIRNNILKKHTLKYVINMPKDLFMPNAATNTAISVFETNLPHANKNVIFYDLKDDGFVLSKSKGRTDVYNKWQYIKEDLLLKLKNPDGYNDQIQLVKTIIKDNDEWLIQAHSKTDYSNLNEKSFEKSVKEYMIFKAKQDMNLLNSNIDEVTLLNLISDYYEEVK